MRLAGRIMEWNDDRGFGFVVPDGGGDRAFVHISAFRSGSRRPLSGDVVSYLPDKDKDGRLKARKVRYAGKVRGSGARISRFFRPVTGIAALMAAAGAAAAGVIPVLLAAVYAGMSIVSWLMYLCDKSAAKKDAQRTPENSLHLADLLGGWPGALIAQQQFHHKTRKLSYQAVFWITVALNLVAAWWLVTSGLAFELGETFNQLLKNL